MTWNVGEAKQRLSEVLRESAREPQIICNRDQPIAAVIDAALWEQFRAWREAKAKSDRGSLADRFEEARRIAAEEEWELEVPARADRDNAMFEEAPPRPRKPRVHVHGARRHQRNQ